MRRDGQLASALFAGSLALSGIACGVGFQKQTPLGGIGFNVSANSTRFLGVIDLRNSKGDIKIFESIEGGRDSLQNDFVQEFGNYEGEKHGVGIGRKQSGRLTESHYDPGDEIWETGRLDFNPFRRK